jgi:hypothetical protein
MGWGAGKTGPGLSRRRKLGGQVGGLEQSALIHHAWTQFKGDRMLPPGNVDTATVVARF